MPVTERSLKATHRKRKKYMFTHIDIGAAYRKKLVEENDLWIDDPELFRCILRDYLVLMVKKAYTEKGKVKLPRMMGWLQMRLYKQNNLKKRKKIWTKIYNNLKNPEMKKSVRYALNVQMDIGWPNMIWRCAYNRHNMKYSGFYSLYLTRAVKADMINTVMERNRRNDIDYNTRFFTERDLLKLPMPT